MQTLEIPYFPHDKQLPFHNSKARYRLLCTGAGFGKTAAGVNELLKMAVEECKSGCQLFLAAPTYKMLKRVVFKEFFKFCPQQIIKRYNKTEAEIELVNGVTIIGVAGDTDRTIDKARGLTVGGGYGDEIGMWQEYFFDILMARIRDDRGPLEFIGGTTPKGMNWVFRVFFEKKDDKGIPYKNPQDYEMFGGTTWDNPYTPQIYKQNLANKYSGDFARQEIEGKFVKFKGLVYPGFDMSAHVVTDKQLPKIFKDGFGMIDWGFTNPSVCLFGKVDNDGRIYVLDEIYETNMVLDELERRIKLYNQKWQANRFYADPSEPANIAALNMHDIPCIPANNNVLLGISEVNSRLKVQSDGKPRIFVHQRCINTIKEFLTYRYKDVKEDREVKEEPLKVNDHAVDCTRYGCLSLFRGNDEEDHDYITFA